ncbi:hypothetical protein [Streptomyces sp. NPDC127038]|uniref:hypothetical protein n=1 Tax=Streptomyces sp. NPDC127038 TaxID=3347114 RepID=UPI00364A57A0
MSIDQLATYKPVALPGGSVQQAVALTLLRDGYTERSIRTRTGIRSIELYPLAAAHGFSAPHGTPEGAACHQAAGDDGCTACDLVQAREDARTRAKQRRTLTPTARARLLQDRRPAARR